MAKYWEDWSGQTLGTGVPTGWTQRWNATNTTYTIGEDANGPAGRVLTINSSTAQRRLLSLNAVDADPDRATVKIRVLCRLTGAGVSATSTFGPAARAAAGETDVDARFSFTTAPTRLYARIAGYNSGSFYDLVQADDGTGTSYGYNPSEIGWLGIDLDGTDATLYWYDPSDLVTPLETVSTSAVPVTAAGWVGLFTFSQNFEAEVYAVAIATGADAAFFEDPDAATGPSLSAPALTATGETTATGAVTTDTATGTLYAYVSTSATAPSAADLKAGTGAVWSGNQAISTTGEKTFSVTGLTASTTYHAYYLHNDGTDDSSIVTASDTTDAAATPISFSGTVSNQSYVEDAAIAPLDLSGFFSGSETPFSYAVTTGTLPAGLSLNTSTGIISGTPTTPAAAVSIVVTATDAGTDTAATNAFDITITAAVVVVKGVRVRLYDDADAAAASITGIQCAWFDQPEPKDFLAPELVTSTASTDADGWLELNIDSATALAVGANGFLVAYKLDGTNHQDSQVFAGRLTVEDIA